MCTEHTSKYVRIYKSIILIHLFIYIYMYVCMCVDRPIRIYTSINDSYAYSHTYLYVTHKKYIYHMNIHMYTNTLNMSILDMYLHVCLSAIIIYHVYVLHVRICSTINHHVVGLEPTQRICENDDPCGMIGVVLADVVAQFQVTI